MDEPIPPPLPNEPPPMLRDFPEPPRFKPPRIPAKRVGGQPTVKQVIRIAMAVATGLWVFAMAGLAVWSFPSETTGAYDGAFFVVAMSISVCYPTVPYAILMVCLLVAHFVIE